MTKRRQFRAGRLSIGWLLVLSLLLSSPSVMERVEAAATKKRPPKQFSSDNFYTVLGLTKKAKPKDIKKAYRKLALQYHPDKVTDEADKEMSEEIFVKVSEAYSVLSDEEKRKVYDQYGKNGLDAFEKGQDPAAAGFGGFGGFGGAGGGGRQRSGGFGGGSFKTTFNFGGQTSGGFDPFKMFEEFSRGGGFDNINPNSRWANKMGGTKEPPGLFPKGESKVAKLGKPKFPDAKSKHMWLVLFYQTDQKESKVLAKHVESLAAQTTLPYKVGAVDCAATEREKSFCAKEHKLQKFPVVGFVVDGKVLQDNNSQSLSSAGKLHAFAMQHMPKHYIHNINHVAQIEERLLDGKRPAILLLTDKYETSSMLYSLAYQFRTDFVFGETRAKNLKLSQHFKVRRYPTLLCFLPYSAADERYNDDYNVLRYSTGRMDKRDVTHWLSNKAAFARDGAAKRNKARGNKPSGQKPSSGSNPRKPRRNPTRHTEF